MEVLKRIFRNKFVDIPEIDKDAVVYLRDKGVTEEEIHNFILNVLNVEYFTEKEKIDENIVKKFNLTEMKKRRIFPVYEEEDRVYFVINSLLDKNIKEFAEECMRYLGKPRGRMVFKFLLSHEFDMLLETVYKGLSEAEYSVIGNPAFVDSAEKVLDFTQSFDAEVLAELILHKGFENRASDIHIEPLENGIQVRYRIDGHFPIIDPYIINDLQRQALINHFKLKAEMKLEERRRGQDGRIRDVKYKSNSYDLRVSTIATVRAEKVVIRVFEKTEMIPTMKDLGFSKFYINSIQRDMSKHYGLILNTGSVGSGKSTTQRTLLNQLDAKQLNIYSIEDPVERTIPYVNHVCVKETGISFEDHLETLLRQDPDVIAIGEIRNLKTMDMAIKAALTGHLVLATIHTNSAIEAFYRLFNMGVEAYELAAALLGIGSQRLVRTLCPYCKMKRRTEDSEIRMVLGLLSKYERFSDFNISKFEYIYVSKPGGCAHCNYTGYVGRTAIAEYLSITEEMRSYISTKNVTRETLLELADSSFVPIEVDALNKILLGKTTLPEVLKQIKGGDDKK